LARKEKDAVILGPDDGAAPWAQDVLSGLPLETENKDLTRLRFLSISALFKTMVFGVVRVGSFKAGSAGIFLSVGVLYTIDTGFIRFNLFGEIQTIVLSTLRRFGFD
jgi:hypothetical protein